MTGRAEISRRAILGTGILALIGFGAYRAGVGGRIFGATPFQFQPATEPAGFRLLAGGAVTGGGAPFAGISADKPAGLRQAEADVAADLCGTLFGQDRQAGQVPVAYFFDYQCPICRRLTPTIGALQGAAVTWHDLAGLGPASEIAARAAIAAREMGAYREFHDRLMRARLVPTTGYIRAVAEGMDLDADRLLAEMDSPAVTARLWKARALATRLGIYGTPGLVVGRTILVGDISAGDLDRLVALEAADPGPCG